MPGWTPPTKPPGCGACPIVSAPGELRPHIALYLLTDESIAAETEDQAGVYDRTFYRLNDVTDLHSTVLAGIRNRFATPFFEALRAYAAEPRCRQRRHRRQPPSRGWRHTADASVWRCASTHLEQRASFTLLRNR